jgi:hypothetical protein
MKRNVKLLCVTLVLTLANCVDPPLKVGGSGGGEGGAGGGGGGGYCYGYESVCVLYREQTAAEPPAACDQPNEALLCHMPPGHADSAKSQCIGFPAVEAHLAHGDVLGDCPAPP